MSAQNYDKRPINNYQFKLHLCPVKCRVTSEVVTGQMGYGRPGTCWRIGPIPHVWVGDSKVAYWDISQKSLCNCGHIL
jgi:hypothetical protein